MYAPVLEKFGERPQTAADAAHLFRDIQRADTGRVQLLRVFRNKRSP